MAENRKKIIMDQLQESHKPLDAEYFSQLLGVSQQVVVGDIALLRATGRKVIATPGGYLLEPSDNDTYLIACLHEAEDIEDEIRTILSFGCGLVDVIVEHCLYGQISGNLHLYDQQDADVFLNKMRSSQAKPLSQITHNIHLHHIKAPSFQCFQDLETALKEKGFYIPSG